MTKKEPLRVLISVFDKTGLRGLVRQLSRLFILEIVSTGGTARYLAKAGFLVKPVEKVTRFEEILGGRVKTLHPKIFGGILADKKNKNHLQELAKHKLKSFDMVVVNLYPFAKTIKNKKATLKQAIEQIDIGGVALLRAAAKNFESVIPICQIKDYDSVVKKLRQKNRLSLKERKEYAQKVFQLTSQYDQLIAQFLSS